MTKVRIKSAPKTGSQRQGSLVVNTGEPASFSRNSPTVSDTIKPVPRHQATLEAEGGETVVGDLAGDGTLAHMKIAGPRHSEGGVPLDIPDGSFIFSDTVKMRIKDKDILKYFGASGNKPQTPAQLAKRFEINQYMQDAQDPDSDPILARSSKMMVDDNAKKLAELAMVQEAMKGFPDGIPAIASDLIGPEGAAQLQQARMGGKVKSCYQAGGQSGSDPIGRMAGTSHSGTAAPVSRIVYRKGAPFYIGNKKYTIGSVTDDAIILADEKGNAANYRGVDYIRKKDIDSHFDQRSQFNMSGDPINHGGNWFVNNYRKRYNPVYIGSTPQQELNVDTGLDVAGIGRVTKGSTFTIGNNTYTVQDIGYLDMKNRHLIETDRGAVTADDLRKAKLNNTFWTDTIKDYSEVPAQAAPEAAAPAAPASAASAAPAARQAAPASKPVKKAAAKSNRVEDMIDQFRTGGEADFYQDGGAAAAPSEPDYYAPDKILKTVQGDNGVIEFYPDRIVARDKSGKILKEKKNVNSVYGNPDLRKTIDALRASGKYEPVYAKGARDFGTFTTQHQNGATYLPKGGGDLDWNDFQERHPWVEREYQGGFKQFQADLTDPAKHSRAAGWYQDGVNKIYRQAVGRDYFTTDGSSSFSRDGKFGAISYAVPGLRERTAQAAGAPPAVAAADISAQQPGTAARDTVPAAEVPNYNQPQQHHNPWWTQNVLQLGESLHNLFSIRKHDPVLQQVDYRSPEYVPADPGRAIAVIQGVTAADAVEAGLTGSAAVANARRLAANGQAMDKIADVIGQYDNQNRTGAYQADAANAEAYNQTQRTNAAARDEYLGRLATSDQQYDNAVRGARAGVLKNFVAGMTNAQMTGNFNMMFPQFSVNPRTGQVVRTGAGRDIFTDSDNLSGMTGADNTTSAMAGVYKNALEQGRAIGITDEKELHQFAGQVLKTQSSKNAPQVDRYFRGQNAAAFQTLGSLFGSGAQAGAYGGYDDGQ